MLQLLPCFNQIKLVYQGINWQRTCTPIWIFQWLFAKNLQTKEWIRLLICLIVYVLQRWIEVANRKRKNIGRPAFCELCGYIYKRQKFVKVLTPSNNILLLLLLFLFLYLAGCTLRSGLLPSIPMSRVGLNINYNSIQIFGYSNWVEETVVKILPSKKCECPGWRHHKDGT